MLLPYTIGVLNASSRPTTSYSNVGGTGDRTGLITVTLSFAPTAGTASNLVDGGFTANSTDAVDPPVGVIGSNNAKFDFGAGKKVIIDEVTTYWNTVPASGMPGWFFSGSNDDVNYDLIAALNITAATNVSSLIALPPDTGYQYYQLRHRTDGSFGTDTWSTGWWTEIEFKIATV